MSDRGIVCFLAKDALRRLLKHGRVGSVFCAVPSLLSAEEVSIDELPRYV